MADLQTLHQLFEDELRDVYDAERQILKALPKIIDAASDDGLRDALNRHLDETRGHVDRLEQAFESLELKARGKHCSGMGGSSMKGAPCWSRTVPTPSWTPRSLPVANEWNTTTSRHMDR